MLCDVVRRRRRRWAHAPVIHAASHYDQKKRVAWVPISMHTCGSFFYNYGAPLGGPSGRRSSAIMKTPYIQFCEIPGADEQLRWQLLQDVVA